MKDLLHLKHLEKMNLLQRVLNLESGKGRLPTEEDWIYVTHILCKTYGWTLQELKKQPMRFVSGLMAKIALDKKRENEEKGGK
ncbi:hypothetical protein LCGC14_2356360 [marine sediment metagenome]|uniref:Uncharacterized protein n=1 Tax=marine sediment metagenome TaxID=412755 RepID=A0A0F9CV64_9ZZZZ